MNMKKKRDKIRYSDNLINFAKDNRFIMTGFKKVLAVFFSLIILASSAFAQYDKKKKKGMLFDETNIMLGNIEHGKIKIHKMFYLNNTKKALKIVNVETSSPDIKVTWADTVLSPGDSAEISIAQHAKKEGRFSNTVIVHSKAKNAPVRLILTGNISEAPAPVKTQGRETSLDVIPEDGELIKTKNLKNRVFKKVDTNYEKIISNSKGKKKIKKIK